MRSNFELLRQESEALEMILTVNTQIMNENSDGTDARERKEFQFLIELANYWIKVFRENSTLHLIRANVLFSELGNRWESVKSLLYITKNSRKVSTIYASLLLSRIIERGIAQQREEEQENLNFDPSEQLKFEYLSSKFIVKIQSFVRLYKAFWKILLRENPSKENLISTSKLLRDSLEDIESSFEVLQSLQQFVGEYLRLYSAIMIDFEINKEKGL